MDVVSQYLHIKLINIISTKHFNTAKGKDILYFQNIKNGDKEKGTNTRWYSPLAQAQPSTQVTNIISNNQLTQIIN